MKIIIITSANTHKKAVHCMLANNKQRHISHLASHICEEKKKRGGNAAFVYYSCAHYYAVLIKYFYLSHYNAG